MTKTRENAELFVRMDRRELEDVIVDAELAAGLPNVSADVGGMSPEDRKAAILEAIKKTFNNALNASYGAARRKICVDLNYCQARNSDTVTFVLLLADVAFMAQFSTVYPVPSIASYAVKCGWLDGLCQCS